MSQSSAETEEYDIYVVGAGYAGHALVWQCAQQWNKQSSPLRVKMAERQPEGSLGVAYTKKEGYAEYRHAVNLHGERMQLERRIKGTTLVDPGLKMVMGLSTDAEASVAEPLQSFLRTKRLKHAWLNKDPLYLRVGKRNVPRELYAKYIHWATKKAARAKNIQLTKQYDIEICDVYRNALTGTFTIEEYDPHTTQMRQVKAKSVVLATGSDTSERIPSVLESVRDHESFFSGRSIRGIYRRLGEKNSPAHPKSILVIGTGLTGLDVARSHQDAKGNLPENFLMISRHAAVHLLPQQIPESEANAVRAEITAIQRLLDYDMTFRDAVESSNPAALDAIKQAFLTAKNLAQNYTTTDPDVHIKESSKGRLKAPTYSMPAQLLRRAYLGQAVIVTLERSIKSMRDDFSETEDPRLSSRWSARAEEAFSYLDREIVNHDEHRAWITANRTSTSDENVKLTIKMLNEGKLVAATVNAVQEKSERKIDITFTREDGTRELRTIDELYNCTGRDAELDPRSLSCRLIDKRLASVHFTTRGLAIDKNGRLLPPSSLSGRDLPLIYALGPNLQGASLFPLNPRLPSLPPIFASAVPGIGNHALVIAEDLTGALQSRSLEQIPVQQHSVPNRRTSLRRRSDESVSSKSALAVGR